MIIDHVWMKAHVVIKCYFETKLLAGIFDLIEVSLADNLIYSMGLVWYRGKLHMHAYAMIQEIILQLELTLHCLEKYLVL